MSWLKISHPEATLQPGFSFLPPSGQQDDYPDCNNDDGSLPSCSRSDTSESPVVAGTNNGTPEGNSAATPVSRPLWDDITPVTITSNNETATSDTCTIICSGTSSTNLLSSGGSSHSTPERISKFLVQNVPEMLVRKKSSFKRVTGQMVLTSTEGLASMKEKEDKQNKK